MFGVLIMMGVAAVSLIGLKLYCEYKESFEDPAAEDLDSCAGVPLKPVKAKARKTAKKVVKVKITKRKN